MFFWPKTQKISILGHLLLHNAYINVPVAIIYILRGGGGGGGGGGGSGTNCHLYLSGSLLCVLSDLKRNVIISLCECQTSLETLCVCHNLAIAVIFHPLSRSHRHSKKIAQQIFPKSFSLKLFLVVPGTMDNTFL